MKDDYLWNKTGEPNAEIEHLERVLGQLRHKRTSKALPAFEIKPRPSRFSLPKMLAIAAVLSFFALTLAAYTLYRQTKNQEFRAAAVVMVNPVAPPSAVDQNAPASGANDEQVVRGQSQTADDSENKKAAAPAARRRNLNPVRERFFNERERAEGLMAKEQLIKALEITSNKLNSVQQKVQGDKRQGPTS